MRIEVRLFGGLTERVGRSQIAVELPDDATVDTLRRAIRDEVPSLAPLLDRVNVAVDLEVARHSTPIRSNSEVALLPPIAGGSGPFGDSHGEMRDEVHDVRIRTGLRRPPLDVIGAIEAVTTPDVGATAVFLGTVRDHAPDLGQVVGLAYSAYSEMAEKVLAGIATEIATDHPAVRGLVLLHAIGDLAVGEHTILIVCTSAHRSSAFTACSDALERVKARVPVWKRELSDQGAHRWVGLGEQHDQAEAE